MANSRDLAASLRAFLKDDNYEATVSARRAAALDRLDSKGDRSSAADDRSKLTEDE